MRNNRTRIFYFMCACLFSASAFAQDEVPVKNSVPSKLIPSAINARIKELRMGEILVTTDPGATVEIKQVRHEFKFGTAITSRIVETQPNALSKHDREMFINVLKDNFNYAVCENAMKWSNCEVEKELVDYSVPDKILEICDSLNIKMRGHCVFWEKDQFVADWVKALNNDELRAKVTRRAIDITRHYKGRVNEFDLNNEMIHGDFFRRRLGYGVINEMALAARVGNPDITLYVNDYGVLVGNGPNAAAYITQIDNLLKSGVPIGGIGCQGHTIRSKETSSSAIGVSSPMHVQSVLDRLSQFNLPIKITECLFQADDDEGEGQLLYEYFPIFFAHPNVDAILMWGFWEGAHWRPDTAMWKKDWTPTPQALAYRDLVFNKWWTHINDKADSTGAYKAGAFYGDYVITSKGVVKNVTLSKQDKSIHVTF